MVDKGRLALLGAVVFAGASVAYVHWKKSSDSEAMKIAVRQDKVRIAAKEAGGMVDLYQQQRVADQGKGKP